jgi:hypothetical protein
MAKADLKKRWLSLMVQMLLMLFLLMAGIKFFWGANMPPQKEHKTATVTTEDFANCLKQSGLIIYGSDTCGACQNQKRMFGKAFESLNYVNCDFRSEICSGEGVTSYPTWKKDQQAIVGVQKFSKLSEISQCQIPTN